MRRNKECTPRSSGISTETGAPYYICICNAHKSNYLFGVLLAKDVVLRFRFLIPRRSESIKINALNTILYAIFIRIRKRKRAQTKRRGRVNFYDPLQAGTRPTTL